MPTIKPRVTVMLEPDDYAVLAKLAELQGVSKSSLLADLWVQACPVMMRVAKLLSEAKSAQQSVKDGIRDATEAAILEVEPMANQIMMNFDLFEEAIREQIARPDTGFCGGSTGGAADGRSTTQPPPSNTGVRFTKNINSTSSKRGGKS